MPPDSVSGVPLEPGLYQNAFREMPAGLAVFGTGAVLLDASGSFYDAFQFTPAEALGQSFDRLFPCVAESGEPCGETAGCAGCGLRQSVLALLDHGPRADNMLFCHERPGGAAPKWFQVSGAGIDTERGRAALLAFTDVSETHKMLEHLRRMLALDQITGLFNKTSITKILTQQLSAGPVPEPFSVCLADMDDFKRINDSFGHLTGDLVLETFGQACRRKLGPRDSAGRFGGEEFLFLFRGADEPQAAELIRRVYLDFAAFLLREHGISVTLSGGLYSVPAGEPPPGFDHLVDACDDLLYTAKRAGKNQLRSSAKRYALSEEIQP